MVEVDLQTDATTSYSYTITYDLLRSGTASPISRLLVEKSDDNTIGISRTLSEIPSMTWVDTPGVSGTFIYTIQITVTGANIASANAVTRALNATIFG